MDKNGVIEGEIEAEPQGRTGSGTSTASDEKNEPALRRVFEINQVFTREQLDRRFVSNKVVTTKYNCLTFLPKNLFQQFSKMANAYFLFMTLLQLVPGLRDFYGAATTLMPLLFVAGVSMIKDAFEDNKRRKQDNEENRAVYQACPRGAKAFVETKSLDI